MSIDLGNAPVGTPPTTTEQAQLRTSFGMGAADTVEFGGLVPPTGTSAEIDSIFTNSLATTNAIYFDNEKTAQYQAIDSSTKTIISGATPQGFSYYIDNVNGEDASGKINDNRNPFKTITGAFNAWEADNPPETSVSFYIFSGNIYDEVDVMGGVTNHQLKQVTIYCDSNVQFGSTVAGAIFDNSSTVRCIFNGIRGFPQVAGSNLATLYSGAGQVGGFLQVFDIGSAVISSADLINLTSGISIVTVNRVEFTNTAQGKSVVSISGSTTSSEVRVSNAKSVTSSATQALLTLNNSARGIVRNASVYNVRWAHLVDSLSRVAIINCAYARYFLGTTYCITADVANSNVYLQGINATEKPVDANVTVDITFGTLVQDAKAANLVII
jgi:hypothetical protein